MCGCVIVQFDRVLLLGPSFGLVTQLPAPQSSFPPVEPRTGRFGRDRRHAFGPGRIATHQTGRVMTKNGKLLCGAAGGSVVAAICCFTPILVVLLGAVGLSAWLGWIDYVLFPALAFFLALTAYAYNRLRKQSAALCAPELKATRRET